MFRTIRRYFSFFPIDSSYKRWHRRSAASRIDQTRKYCKERKKKKIIFQQTVIKEENEIDGKQKRKKKQMNIEYKEQKTDDNDVSKLW